MDARGFTLLELMVVLLILGMLSGAVMLTLPASDGGVAEAERFAARAKAARDAAIITARPMAFAWDEAGYRAERRTADGWMADTDYRWDEGREGAAGRTLFDPTGLAIPQVVDLGSARVEIESDGAIHVVR